MGLVKIIYPITFYTQTNSGWHHLHRVWPLIIWEMPSSHRLIEVVFNKILVKITSVLPIDILIYMEIGNKGFTRDILKDINLLSLSFDIDPEFMKKRVIT